MAGADVVLTTYGTAVRDIEALADLSWARLVLDEAQVIKNPTSETAQQLRRIRPAAALALTGTPIENGLGDLWAILDFTNPGLVGARAPFIAHLSQGPSSVTTATGRQARPRRVGACGRSTVCWSSGAPRPSRPSPPSCPSASTSSTTAP